MDDRTAESAGLWLDAERVSVPVVSRSRSKSRRRVKRKSGTDFMGQVVEVWVGRGIVKRFDKRKTSEAKR